MVVRVVILLASRMVPGEARQAWLLRWMTGLLNLRILIDRGELPFGAKWVLAAHARAAVADAIAERMSVAAWRNFVRGPALFFAGAGAALVITGLASHGFSNTRYIMSLARLASAPVRRGDGFGVFLTYAIPIVFALLVGIVLIGLAGPGFQRYGWRYWGYFAAKTVLILVVLPVVWLELTPLIKMSIPAGEGPLLFIHLIWRLFFIGAFGYAVGWSFRDQRQRCPVCLKKLALPVTFGSWSSVFEPAVTEFLCEDGHGSLSVLEAAPAAADKWTRLDRSWQELFEAKR